MRRLVRAPAHRTRTLRALGLALAALLALAAATAPPASAAEETYGELERFGAAGTGPGQFKFSFTTHAFGVDQTDDSVYVGDEPQPGVYRIQKLSSTGTFLAQTATFAPLHSVGIEGIAVDPALKRIYVLVLEKRGLPELTIAVAGTLYAFSTEPEGETLPPASGTTEGVLTTPTVFLAHAKPVSRALAEPRGLAVDPSTHDVIAMGEALESEEELESNPIALQRVSATSGALGARYTTNALEHETATVSPAGDVYVEQHDELLQVPSDFASAQAPVRVGGLREEAEIEGEHVLLESPDFFMLEGGGLSFAPVGPRGEPEGTLEAAAGIFNEKAFYPGVVAFDAASGAEAGWSGGATRRAGLEACTISFQGPTYPMIAAGGAGNVFVLDAHFSQVIELGRGGGGCPSAHDGELKALVGGAPLTGEIDEGTEVTLQSSLVQADAVSVEWSFGEGEGEPLVLPGDYLQRTEVTHTFAQSGEHVITEVIHTDDLATPVVEARAVVSVRAGKSPPTAVINGPIAVGVGAQASFDGSASWDPNGPLGATAIRRYEWSFGDGSATSTESPEVQHVYATPGIYTASLVVEDSFGLKSEASSIPVTVQTPLPPPPARESPFGGGLGEGGGEEAAKPPATSPSAHHGGGPSPAPRASRPRAACPRRGARGARDHHRVRRGRRRACHGRRRRAV
jgi:PKD domain